jgi:outer membrane protein TolC
MNAGTIFKPYKSYYIYIIISLLSATSAAHAEPLFPPGSLSIKDTVIMALEGNRSLRIAEEQRDGIRATAEAATGRLLPRINASYGVSRTDSPINVFGSKLLQKRFTASDFTLSSLNNPGTINNYHTDISIIVPVYQGGALWAGKHAGDASAKSAEWQYMAQRQMTILHVIETFSLLRESQAERRATEQALVAARDHLAETQALKRRGLAITSDVMDARSHMLEAEVALESASHAVTSTQEKLQRLLGLPPGAPLSTSGTIELALPDQSPDEWLEAAIRSQPELQAAKHRLDAARAHTDVARAPFRPAVNLQATEEWNSNTAMPKNANASIAAEVRLNLFSGGTDRARLHAARAVSTARELELEDIAQAIHNEVLSSWRRLQEAKNRLVASKQVLRQNMESLRIRKLREQQGLERSSDVLDAQSRADQARAKAIRARYALIIAKARLLASAGQLTPEVVR